MNIEIRDKLSPWYKNLDGKNSILTGDFDSLFGHHLIKKKFDIDVKGFYNFKSIYFTDGDRKNTFGIDMDTMGGKTFGNHLTHFYKNTNAINLNNYVGNIKYYQKYPFSTVMLILSLYDFDMESMTDEQLKIILAIDVGFKGYYTDKQFFKDVYLKWLDRLDIRFLEDRILKKTTRKEMYDIILKYNLNGTIRIDPEGYLETNIDLEKISEVFDDIIELPTHQFNLHKSYQYRVINPNTQSVPDRDNIISMAWTSNNELKMTIK